ncbi:MAG: MBL fold metallo-hydrolase [bacterium]
MNEQVSKPRITFYGGVGVVTGANFLLETLDSATGTAGVSAGKRILVDCGLEQGSPESSRRNRKAFEYDPAGIDFLFITHAHLDHVGRIGKLVKDGFRGVIYSTPETKALAELIMEDAVGLLAREAQRGGVLPLYEAKDVGEAIGMWKTIEYYTHFPVCEGVSVYLRDAGHILGSAMIEFTLALASGEKRKVLFTGDLGNSPTPLLKDTESIENSGADYLVMESVYGDRNHEPVEERKEKLKRVINETVARRGVVVIPAFSVERTQVILYELNNMVDCGQIPSVPVYVDSPLAIKVTDIYKKSTRFFNQAAQADASEGDHQLFNFPRLKYVPTNEASRAIENMPGPKVIIAGSGMSAGGRVIRHEAEYLPDEKNTILLVGYQSVGTLGRQLLDGHKTVRINERDIRVKAHIETIYGYSSHKDSDHLVEFVGETASSLKKVFVAMGEPKASLFLVQKLRDNVGVDAVMPERVVAYEIK